MRLRLVPALLLVTGTAAAAPLAQLSQDVDGDGKADAIQVDATGTLTIAGKQVKLGATVSRAKLGVAQFRGAVLVVVDTGSEAIIVGQRNGTWREMARTAVGPAGSDGDYAVAVDATPEGIYRYQVRPGGARCDGKPSYLFGEGFDGTKFQRLSKLPIDVPASAPSVTAKADASPIDAQVYKARFASHEPGATDASALPIPSELDDGNVATAWHDDFTKSAGEGQYFNFVPRIVAAKATRIRIVPGNAKGANRPARLAVVGANAAFHVELPDAAKDKAPGTVAYIADLPSPIAGCVTVIVEDTYGGEHGMTSIAELSVHAIDDGDNALARAVSEGREGETSAAQALARHGASAVAAIDAELARTTDVAARGRLVHAATAIRDPAVAPILVRAIDQGMLLGPDLVAAVRALAGLGAGNELADLALKSGAPLEVRVEAARALQASDPKERDLLVSIAGRGTREVRQAVIERLTAVPVATLVPLAQAQAVGNAKGAGDIWRAITRRAHTHADERPAASAALTAALPSATDYELRYRLIDGIAATGDAAALKALAQTLASYPPDEQTAAYKQVAARAIAVNARPEASDLVIGFASDRDPGVRLAALSALATAMGTAPGPWNGDAGVQGIDRVFATALATDTWPDVRRAAAASLSTRCSRPGPAAALADAVDRDADLAVRGDALAGLVECKAVGVADRLAKLWDDSKAPLELRSRAVDLTAPLGDAALGAKLVAKYSKWRGAALESEAALELAKHAAIAIGVLSPPGAVDALVKALDDEAFPEIQAGAASGLGLLGPACPATVRKRLIEMSSTEEAQVATAAKRAAAVCGAPAKTR